ncbi:MAG: peptidoglycan DD-metalloendopeptidase family protein [Armatimonadetes bacterium]|nr:peptidoglycan DD-metalloendopeptidase family protein [Armatimonadota bacterium]
MRIFRTRPTTTPRFLGLFARDAAASSGNRRGFIVGRVLSFQMPVLVLALTFSALVLSVPGMAAPKKESIKQRIHQLLQRKVEKKQKAKDVRKKLRVLKKKEKAISSQVQETQQHLQHARKEYADTSQKLQQTRSQLVRTQDALKQAQIRLARHNESLGDRLVSIYRNGSLTYVEILLDSQSFSDVVKRTYLFRKIVENDLSLLRGIREEKDQIVEKKNTLQSQHERVQALNEDAEEKKAEIGAKADEERQLLFKVRHERAAYEQWVRELEQSSNEIADMIRRLTASRAGGYLTPWKGGFIRPVSGSVSSSFGYRRHPIFKVRRLHTGVDLSAAYGTIVKAAGGGRCIFAGWKRAYGQTVVVDHGGGLATVYGHCSALMVSSGSRVTQGQSIARVGSTGISTGPHLHFEVRRNGSPVNPLRLR